MSKPTSINRFATETAGIRLKRILVPTDFSEASRPALAVASELATQFRASITLIHVFPTALPTELSHLGILFEQKRLATQARERLLRFREQELPAVLPVETILLEGGPAFEINRLAKDSETDLIIAATHGHTGLKHLWLGSTAERIVRHAPCPVLVVRCRPTTPGFPGEGVGRFLRIILAVDFSDASRCALAYAVALAQASGGEITLIHVIEPPPYPEFGYARIPAKEAALKRNAREKLESLAEELVHAGVKAACVIRHGNPFHEIAEQAYDQSADLIVVAAHGRGAIARALLGSTAERVVRHAPSPVLVVREREHEFVSA
ncbi:MAG: universal stress protein [Verrucomicrobia bacterium]|nr:universal stress protein [Verrucomicrobiota bacterium]